MDNLCQLWIHGDPLQKMRFLGALYLTHPEDAPAECHLSLLARSPN